MSRFICRRRYASHPGQRRQWLAGLCRPAAAPGDAVDAFERALAEYHGLAGARCFSSGREALLRLLDALGLAPGDEIIVPAYTLKALLELLAEAGYRPVVVDCGADYQLDPAAVAAAITPESRVLLATHLFGQPCAIDALARLARQHGLLLIEDCAQALGSEVNGCKVGSFGAAAILSFDLLKPVNSYGGGAILSNDPALLQRLDRAPGAPPLPTRQLARRFLLGQLEQLVITTPVLARLASHALQHPRTRVWLNRRYRAMQHRVRPRLHAFSALQATTGLRQLASLDARVAVRRALAYRLSQLLGEARPARDLNGGNGYFFVRQVIGDPARLRRELLAAGIDSGFGGEVADYCAADAADCPNAWRAWRQTLQLPLHEGMGDAELQRIAACCRGRLHPY